MSTATLEKPVDRPATAGVRSRIDTPVRRPRRPGPGVGPSARPTGPVPAPSVRVVRPSPARSCVVDVPAARQSVWRLTERGVAVVLVLAALIVTAAVVVVTLTAYRVTGDGYDSVREGRIASAPASSTGS